MRSFRTDDDGGAAIRFPAVLVAAAGGGAAREAVELAGGRVVAMVELDALDPADWVDQRPVVVADIPGDAAGGAIERLATIIDDHALAAVIAFELDALDAVAAALMGPTAHLLCTPDIGERVGAMAIAARFEWSAPAGVREDGERLRRLTSEIGRIAEVLTRLATEATPSAESVGDRRGGFDPGPAAGAPVDPQAIRRAIRARRMRDAFFPPALLEEPAWDILLDLFAAELEDTRVSVSSLCIAAAVAPTTALRWITRMTEQRLLLREPDPEDRRRAFIALEARASAGMRNYAAALARAGLAFG